MTKIDKTFLSESFPIIAKYIRQLYDQHQRFVMRDELAEAFRLDKEGKRLLKLQIAKQGGEMVHKAGNTIDWFSAKFKIKSPMVQEWLDEFERTTLRDKFAYRPKGAIDDLTESLPLGKYSEGSVIKVFVNKYERNPAARTACIEHYGKRCSVCRFDFKRAFGELGDGYIQVHHLIPLAKIGKSYKVDPIADLRPVCPNCHAMLHRGSSPLSIDELIEVRLNAKTPKTTSAKS